MVRRIRRNKKGSGLDLGHVAAAFLAIAIVTIIAFKVSDEFNTKVQADDAIAKYDVGGKGRAAMNNVNGMYSGVVDNSFLLLVMGASVAAFVMAAMVRIHPVFFVFFLLILAIIIVICGVFSNIYQEIAEEPDMQSVASQLVFISNIMTYLPFIVGVVGIILAVIMYKTWENG